MSSATIKKIIPCKKEQLVEMVLDIEKYPEFDNKIHLIQYTYEQARKSCLKDGGNENELYSYCKLKSSKNNKIPKK